jgi:hypothetical protein
MKVKLLKTQSSTLPEGSIFEWDEQVQAYVHRDANNNITSTANMEMVNALPELFEKID